MIKTNAGGRMLISYRRQRADEVAFLEQALPQGADLEICGNLGTAGVG